RLEDRAGGLNDPVEGGAHPSDHRMANSALNILEGLAGVALEPAAVEFLGCAAELHEEGAGEVFGFDFAAFLPPKARESGLIGPHDDWGIRAANKALAITGRARWRHWFHLRA